MLNVHIFGYQKNSTYYMLKTNCPAELDICIVEHRNFEENFFFTDHCRCFTCIISMARCMFNIETGKCGSLAAVAAFHFQ